MSTKIDDLVNRFLTWPVPADVWPDGTPGQPGRTGTNLMTADQAKQMLTHVLGDVMPKAEAFDIARLAARVMRERCAQLCERNEDAGFDDGYAHAERIRQLDIDGPLEDVSLDWLDSVRYRWLRDEHIGDDPASINLAEGPKRGLSAAIDAAMEREAIKRSR